MEKLILINPYNNNHIKLVEEFEQNNHMNSRLSNLLKCQQKQMPEKQNQIEKKQSNAIEEYGMIIEASKVKNICHIQGEKDRKSCQISFSDNNKKNLRRKSIITATNYALSYLGMCEAFIIMDSISKEIESYLIQNGYEGLGKDEKGKSIFLIEKNPKEINKGNYHETRR